MTKRTISITVDADTLEEVKALRINLSGSINEYLSSLVAKHNEDVDGINERLERLNLEKGLRKLRHWQDIVKRSQTKLEKWEEIQAKKEENDLKEEKEKIESLNRCINCGTLLEEGHKKHTFNKGIVCNGCVMNMKGSDFKKWSQK